MTAKIQIVPDFAITLIPSRFCLRLASIENHAVTFALALLAVIPVAEIALRATLEIGISASAALVQHLVLVAGMLGAAIAARENRLLSISIIQYLLPDRYARAARMFSGLIGILVCLFLCIASYQFVQVERDSGNLLSYSIPVWTAQAILPTGFALIAWRLLKFSSDHWQGKLGVSLLTSIIAVALVLLQSQPEKITVVLLVLLLIATLLGTPMFVTIGGAALILFWGDGLPIASIPLDHYRLVVNPSLPMIPLFTLAGFFLAEGGAPQRLIRVFRALFSNFRGSAAMIAVLISVFFTSFTGASGVTILALGGMLMPLLIAERYRNRSALGLLTSAGSLGGLLPPGLPLVLYAIIAQVPIKEMFLGGLVPCLVLVGLVTWWGIRQAPQRSHTRIATDWHEAGRAILAAKWELLIPVVAFGGLFGGIATPVEAAALTAVYAFVVETFIYRDLSLKRDSARVMSECGLLTGGILLILGVALSFTNYLVDAQIPDLVIEWVRGSIESRWVFLLSLNLFLLVVGCLMDIYSATIVVVPLIVPLGLAFGIDPVHLGIIFLANLELGYLTPPVGMNLFFASSRFDKPLMEVYRSVTPALLILITGVLIITYFPALSTFLPQLIK